MMSKLAALNNIAIVLLLPKAPNSTILNHCCGAWNKLFKQPWRIMSIGLRDRVRGFEFWYQKANGGPP